MAAIGNAIMLLEMQKPNLDPDKNLSGATTYTCVELFIQLRIFGTVVKNLSISMRKRTNAESQQGIFQGRGVRAVRFSRNKGSSINILATTH